MGLTLGDLAEIVEKYFSTPISTRIFSRSHLSEVHGLELASGETVVVKVRPWSYRLELTGLVHSAAFEKGLPCPEPLVGLDRFGAEDFALTIERFEPSGRLLPRNDRLLTSSVEALHQTLNVLNSTQVFPAVHHLESVPWLNWNSGQLWPKPDDLQLDLNAVATDDWIDQLAIDSARVLHEVDLPCVIGHGDFESSNVLFTEDGTLAMIHDWDSVVCLPEACIVGAASVVYVANDEPVYATADQSRRYVREFQRRSGRHWTNDEERAAIAAGTWLLAFNAKKEAARNATGVTRRQLMARTHLGRSS